MEVIDETLKNIRSYEHFMNMKLQISGVGFERKQFFNRGLIEKII